MQNTIVHYEGAASLEAVATKVKPSGARIKIGLDVHARLYVAVAQYDHLLPKAARRLRPGEFVPWVEELLRGGHTVHVVYEACGFGFSLYRQLIAAGAHCYVIAPCKLDEECSRVKTDPRDATTLCQRLSRYLEGNTRELAVIRVPSQAGRASASCFTATHPVGVSPSKARSARTLTFDQPRSAGAGPLVERANLDSVGPASACLDHDPSANGASSALKLAGADQRPNK
jgi:hypothetical protein